MYCKIFIRPQNDKQLQLFNLENEINDVIGVLISLFSEVNRDNEKSHLSTDTTRTGIQVAAPATPFQRRQQTALALVSN